MKTLSIIHISSFVDLITNSSSELFVCETRKSKETVKQIVEKIIRNYYDERDIPCPDIWADVFQEPEVAERDLDLDTYPDQEDVKMATDYDYFNNEKKAIGKLLDEKFPEPVECKDMSYEEKWKNKKWKKWADERNKERANLIQPFWDKKEAAHQRLQDYFGVDTSILISYNIKVRKGDILLWSASDNSVPYDCWDRIESLLSATRYHEG